jgi:hypothetical protein
MHYALQMVKEVLEGLALEGKYISMLNKTLSPQVK